ncbi:MAG: hypothetical protein LBE80_06555 [Deltaproteobacteria bacterium]|jgi:hypothetical protein|nr:hypothetical protein [Deltaproteobacteria bacterium]
MRFCFFAIFTAFCLLVSLYALPASAQFDDLYGLNPEIESGLTGLGFTTLRGYLPDGKCQGFFNQVGVTYPFGTGSTALDKILADSAKADFDGFLKSQMESCPENVDTTDTPTAQHRKTFRATTAGKKYLSFYFSLFEEVPFAAHPSSGSSAVVYDLQTAKPIELGTIFVDAQKAMPELWAYLVKGWCDQGKGAMPSYYNLSSEEGSCGSKTPPLPDTFKADPVPFTALGATTLTPNGLSIQIDAIDAWSMADGPGTLEVPKDYLVSIGAKKEVWE